MRRLVLIVLLVMAGLIGTAWADRFPVPRDAKPPTAAKGGGGRIQTYEIPRGKDAVAAEVRADLKAAGWEITSDQVSPNGGAIRLVVKKGSEVWRASLSGDATRTALIVTSPAPAN